MTPSPFPSPSLARALPLSRRAFLRAGAALGGLAALSAAGGAALARVQPQFVNPLAIPPLDTGRSEGGLRIFELTMRDGVSEFFKGYQTATRGINADFLAPVLRLRRGERVRFEVTNALDEVTTLHWHGFNLPASADGGPHQPIAPGQTWSPEFEIVEAASTMWFHSHQMHKTAEQVWAGLAGMVIIDDDASPGGLPASYGVDDIPVVLQDRRFQFSGAMPYTPNMHDLMAGMQGNYPLVNGTIAPWFDVTTERLRLRLLNGANASIYNLAFSDGRDFQVIATDGGLLAAPVTLNRLELAPGERAEIVVSFAPGEPVVLRSVAAPGAGGAMMGGGMMGGGMMGGGGEQSPIFDILELRPGESLAPSAPLPARLADLPAPDPGQASNRRRFALEMGMGPRMMTGRGGFTINGREMDMERIDEVVKKGESEIWEITVTGPMAHPFHVHNTQFRILSRNGRPPAPQEAGRKDTVLVHPREVVEILVRFDNYTDAELPYMYHCHILEHEDAGMMGQFTVV